MVAMRPDKNLHAFLPATLLSKLEQAAVAEHLTVDEFVADAIERRLSRGELADVLSFGKRYARERGLEPGDVAAAIAADRSKERGR